MTRHEKALTKLRQGTVIPATPLVLDGQRRFDPVGQKKLMQYYLQAGAGGIATAVHSSQFEIRDPDVQLLEPLLSLVSQEVTAYEEKTGEIVVKVAGVCGPVEQACREAHLAKSYGYDAVLLSPGGLNHLSEEVLLERAKAVSEILPVIGFYLQTSVGGRVFSYDFWVQFCEIPNVIAIKCASFNRYTTLDVVRACALSSRRDEITLYTGNDDNIVIDLLTEYAFTQNGVTYRKGFKGGLLGHWCIWTKTVVDLFNELQEVKQQDTISQKWLRLANDITDANAVVFDGAHGFAGCIPGIHEVLRRQGLMDNILCLNPEETLSSGQAEELDRIHAMYPHLHDDDFVKEFLRQF